MIAPAIMWFRRDLRLADNPALIAAAAHGRAVLPLFVIDPRFDTSGRPRRAYLHDALAALDESMGGALVCRRGSPLEVVPAIAAEVGAGEVFVARDHGPYGSQRDAAVGAALAAADVGFRSVGSPYAVDPGQVRKTDGTPFSVFTPFSRAWRTHVEAEPQPAPSVTWTGRPTLASDGLPPRPPIEFELPGVGERAAWQRWERFAADALDRYVNQRNAPGIDGTSQLSADLRWGVVHPRQILSELAHTRSQTKFGTEVIWREFYADVLSHHPESATQNLNRRMDAMRVDEGAGARTRFGAWTAGRTGYPIIDAGMRQLHATGWMHNRVRMLTASFLVKDLHLPWQWGAHHFMEHLIDGDLASNSHGWQWSAGTGTDAAPYFRVMNPTIQSRKFDAGGAYLRRWLPELAGLDDDAIHDPGPKRPDGYPPPIVDHASERLEALARYQSAMAGSR